MPWMLEIDDDKGDVVDRYWYHEMCAPPDAELYPSRPETDYDVHCEKCGGFLWGGIGVYRCPACKQTAEDGHTIGCPESDKAI